VRAWRGERRPLFPPGIPDSCRRSRSAIRDLAAGAVPCRKIPCLRRTTSRLRRARDGGVGALRAFASPRKNEERSRATRAGEGQRHMSAQVSAPHVMSKTCFQHAPLPLRTGRGGRLRAPHRLAGRRPRGFQRAKGARASKRCVLIFYRQLCGARARRFRGRGCFTRRQRRSAHSGALRPLPKGVRVVCCHFTQPRIARPGM